MAKVPPGCRVATEHEFLSATLGFPFPWGSLPQPDPKNHIWHLHRVSVSGLIHEAWFVTAEGRRYGGAPNVPTELPGSLRSSFLYDGGASEKMEENEGYAVVRDASEADMEMYREVQFHAVKHIVADGGRLIVSPIGEGGVVEVGFVGRCAVCPNARLASFPQLAAAVPKYTFQLASEWR